MKEKKNESWTSTTIYNRILVLCEENGWTINRLADLAGITPSTLYMYRYRESMPKIETLVDICDAFDITLSRFFMVDDKSANELFEAICRLSESSRELIQEVVKRMKE